MATDNRPPLRRLSRTALDRALADALRALHQDVLTEPVPPSLLAAAHGQLREVHERTNTLGGAGAAWPLL
jgi:hypothetical protein